MTKRPRPPKSGRILFVPTEEQRKMVQAMVAYGIPQEDLCLVVENPQTGKPLTPKTLRRAFRKEIKTGKTTMITNVANSLYNKALGKGAQSVTACIFILKTQAGWKDKIDVNLNLTDHYAEKLTAALTRLDKRLAHLGPARG